MIPALVSNQLTLGSVHPNARRTPLEGKRAPSPDSEEKNSESRHNGVDNPEAPAQRIAEQVLKTPLALGKQNPRGLRVKTDSRGPPKKTEKQSSLASPPKQRVKKPSERKSLQPQAAKQEPLGNEAMASEVQDKVQAHLRWRSALFKSLNHVRLTNPGEEFRQLPPFPCPIPNLLNVLERPVRTTKIDNAIWKYMIGQSAIL
jgi:small-conductance mechanosensitive channel